MDERNVLLDELASYIPIEVTYYKDQAHDGVDANGNEDLSETYHLDSNDNPMFKKEWPDDLRVEMVYYDANGTAQRLTLVEGTEGSGSENYGRLSITGNITDPTNFEITFTGSAKNLVPPNAQQTLTLEKDGANGGITGTPASTGLGNGSIQASLDMLWKTGDTTTNKNNDVRGYEYYRSELDTLAKSFADVMNAINNEKHPAGTTQDLFVSKNGTAINAATIGINPDWTAGAVKINTGGNGTDPNTAILNMMEALTSTWPNNGNNLNFIQPSPNLKNNSFADYMNHVSTVLANDSYSNTVALKTNVTVLNGIQNSRDSISGVSLNEEASNMMMFQSAYQAASRLMTALDQVLDVLINSTGTCGR